MDRITKSNRTCFYFPNGFFWKTMTNVSTNPGCWSTLWKKERFLNTKMISFPTLSTISFSSVPFLFFSFYPYNFTKVFIFLNLTLTTLFIMSILHPSRQGVLPRSPGKYRFECVRWVTTPPWHRTRPFSATFVAVWDKTQHYPSPTTTTFPGYRPLRLFPLPKNQIHLKSKRMRRNSSLYPFLSPKWLQKKGFTK